MKYLKPLFLFFIYFFFFDRLILNMVITYFNHIITLENLDEIKINGRDFYKDRVHDP